MPFISEAASAIKGRFGFHEHHNNSSVENSVMLPSVRSSPDLLFKSAIKDSASNHPSSSAIRSVIRDRGEEYAAGTTKQTVFEFRDDPSFWKDHNVQVVIRIRPLSSAEISVQGSSKCVRQESSQTITWTGPPESRFTFDHVADEHVTQEMLFRVAGLPMVENCMGGYNSCMFAYGQTGSGKTHTMLGDIDGGTRRHSVNSGMTPRVFEHLFSRIQKDREARRDEKLRFTCKCSFLEIYNEQILDLLDPSSSNLQIREDTKKGVYVDNLTEVEVASARDVIQQLVKGSANRKVAATNMNRASSRSHSVFTCIIESKWESQGVTHHRFSRLNLVDLAGSERQKSSGAEGERLKEATNINKSLSTLGLVIMNLVNVSNGKSLHVPYRDSKLTFLLQDSLGGNSKTTIIANISPSSCCSLETLSTLKFAQRAKFIKNHATVNEDASGDVLAMRMQIQELKKEVSRLQNLANGGTQNHDSDAWSLSFPGSPGTFKWEGLHGSFNSPLTSSKRTSQNKEHEVVLVSALRREKDKDLALQALTTENQAAMQLAKQREAEIQGLKMRLRFREAAIKRLEGVSSGKISAETHLLKEKEEHLKEIEVLCTQVDRTQEVTRFAMENLRLKEEIRRLKSFAEEGERERMNEQIAVLQNKLLEALDWKLMHEPDPSVVQNNNFELGMDMKGNGAFSKEPASPWCKQKSQTEIPSLPIDSMPNVGLSDQIELQTMVDAIASASQREAESHETAIILSKENDDLRMKLKELIEDNNRLIDLYEQVVAERHNEKIRVAENAQNDIQHHSSQLAELSQEKELERKMEVENLEHQLMEMHEENEKLLGLYEKAMQERDEFKRMFSSSGKKRDTDEGEFDCMEEKLVQVDGGEPHKSDEAPSPGDEILEDDTGLLGSHVHVEMGKGTQIKNAAVSCEVEAFLEEADLIEVRVQDEYSPRSTPRASDYMDLNDPASASEAKNNVLKSVILESSKQDGNIAQSENATAGNIANDLTLVRRKLDKAQEMLLNSSRTVAILGSLEKVNIRIDNLVREIEALNDSAQVKRQECESSKFLSSELHERRNLLEKKLMAIKYSISSFSSSINYFEQREIQARARTKASSASLNQNKEVLIHLQTSKSGFENTQMKMKISEVELKKYIADLTLKVEEENRRREDDKVLLAIDNVDKTEIQSFPRKAIELLRSEEEKTKLQGEIKLAREKLGITRKDIESLTRKLERVDNEMKVAQVEVEKGMKSVEEMEHKLQSIIQEKEAVAEMEEKGKSEFENLMLEYQQCLFEAELKVEEMRILEEELQVGLKRLEELQTEKAMAMNDKSWLLEMTTNGSCFVSDQVEEDLQNVRLSFLELKSLFGDDGSNNTRGLVNVV